MSFTYVAANIAPDDEEFVSVVRWVVQDTDEATAEVTDEEIEALYSSTPASDLQIIRNLHTALLVALALERRYRKQATFSSGGTSVQLGARAEAWAEVVTQIEAALSDERMKALGMSPGVVQFGRSASYDDGLGGGVW